MLRLWVALTNRKCVTAITMKPVVKDTDIDRYYVSISKRPFIRNGVHRNVVYRSGDTLGKVAIIQR